MRLRAQEGAAESAPLGAPLLLLLGRGPTGGCGQPPPLPTPALAEMGTRRGLFRHWLPGSGLELRKRAATERWWHGPALERSSAGGAEPPATRPPPPRRPAVRTPAP